MKRSPNFLLFLAGIAAAAGTTLLTSIPAVQEHGGRALRLALCSLPWFLLSWLLAETGTLLEEGRRRADLFAHPTMSADELEAIELAEYQKIRGKLTRQVRWSVASLVSAIAALLLLF